MDPLGLHDDCGGPCSGFSYQENGFIVIVSYYVDDIGYDEPLMYTYCPAGGPVAVTSGGGAGRGRKTQQSAPNSGLTKKQAACAADAAINGALSIFVPGYAATKALTSFGGFSFNPVGALTGTSGLFSAGNPTLLQTAGGLAGANDIYQDSRFAAAGGASALARVQDLTSRVGFGAQTGSRQGRLLSQLGNLESLEGAVSFASKANMSLLRVRQATTYTSV